MTYTIIGRCARTRRLGLGIATFSLGVGGYCPFIAPGRAAISTQAYVNPRLGVLAMRLLGLGYSPRRVVEELASEDADIEYCQVGIVDGEGVAAVHSGTKIRSWSGDIQRPDLVAMGNALAGAEVIEAMADAFAAEPARDLDERLLGALEAGRDAGGQEGGDGHLDERSAVLTVYAHDPYPEIDLRVDVHEHAVDELRRVHGLYKPYLPYYRLRGHAPRETPPQEVWARDNLGG